MSIGNPIYFWNKKSYYNPRGVSYKTSLGVFTEYSQGVHKVLKEDGSIESQHSPNNYLVEGSLYFISVKERYPSYIIGRSIPAGGDYRVCVARFVKINDDFSGTFKDDKGEFVVTLQRQVQQQHPLIIDMIPGIGDSFQIVGSDEWYTCSRNWRDGDDNFFFFDDEKGVVGFHAVDKSTVASIRNS